MGGAVKKIPGGEVISSIVTGKPTDGEKPNRELYKNPYEDELMSRFIGAIDAYNERRFAGRGIKSYVPREQREAQANEEQAQQSEPQQRESDGEENAKSLEIERASKEQDSEGSRTAQKAMTQMQNVSMVPVSTTVDPELRKRALQQAMANTKFAPAMRFRG